MANRGGEFNFFQSIDVRINMRTDSSISVRLMTPKLASRQPRPQRIFLLQEEGEKEALEHLKQVIKICPNRGHIFQNNLKNTWTNIQKTRVLVVEA